MSLKQLLKPFCSAAARICEKSPAVASIIRSVKFRGKGLIVQEIRSEGMCREVIASCGSIRYRLDLRDDVQRELYFGVYEQKDLAHALKLIPSGGTCLDIGANNGIFALQFARKVGPGGVVHAFEPDPDIFARLVSNARLNGFDDVLACHQVAVSNVSGVVPFYRSNRAHSGWGSLVQFNDIAVETEQMNAVTIDEFVRQEGITTIDFVKVDVEAHEPELLQGARQCLLKQIFRFILIEFNGVRLAQRGIGFDEFVAPLTRAGYVPVGLRLELLKKIQDRSISSETVVANFLFAASAVVGG